MAYFESLMRQTLKDHYEREKKEGREIWPARRNQPGFQLDEDELFCKSICKTAVELGPDGGLVW